MATQLDLRPTVSTTATPAVPRQPQPPDTRVILDMLWRHLRAAFGLTVAVSAVVASAIGLTMPRFSATAGQALLVMVLGFVQPLVRGWSRYFTWLRFKRTPRSVISRREYVPANGRPAGTLSRRIFWSKEGRDRHYLLGAMFDLLEEEGWRYSVDSGWNEWDIQIYGNFWWSIALQTVTEYHADAQCLTRVRLRNRFVTTTMIFNLVALSLLIYRQLNIAHVEFWSIAAYLVFVLFLAGRARALKSRVAELVDLAAYRAGLQRVLRRQPIAKPEVTKPEVEAPVAADPAARV